MAKSRYSILSKVIDAKDFNSRYESFPAVTGDELRNPNDTFITWDETQRLDNISKDYLGDSRYWWTICLLNDLKFPFGELNNGQVIRIPASVEYIFSVLSTKKR